MFKKAAIIIALLGVLGSGQTEWLDTGLAAARKISGAVPEDLTELLSSVVRQKQPERRKSISKQAYTGRVSSVSDGDTLHVTDSDGLKHKIRLAYIDAPELQQAYGTRSHQNLKRAADGENVNVTVFELDRYGREVAQVRMDGEDLNLMQIRDGAAWHYNAYAAKKQKKNGLRRLCCRPGKCAAEPQRIVERAAPAGAVGLPSGTARSAERAGRQ